MTELINLNEMVDSFVEELPDFVSSFSIVIIIVVYVLFKAKLGKKKGPNNTAQTKYPSQSNQQGRQMATYAQRNQPGNRAGNQYDRPNAGLFHEPSAMPHEHRKSGVYDTYNKKSWRNDSGTMPHKHEKGHYTSMMDTSKLPKGYILLNGEPVRVADLEGK